MKKIFGRPNIKKDGTPGKVRSAHVVRTVCAPQRSLSVRAPSSPPVPLMHAPPPPHLNPPCPPLLAAQLTVMPAVEELQRGEDTRWTWVNYSAYDAKNTWDLYRALHRELTTRPAQLDGAVAHDFQRVRCCAATRLPAAREGAATRAHPLSDLHVGMRVNAAARRPPVPVCAGGCDAEHAVGRVHPLLAAVWRAADGHGERWHGGGQVRWGGVAAHAAWAASSTSRFGEGARAAAKHTARPTRCLRAPPRRTPPPPCATGSTWQTRSSSPSGTSARRRSGSAAGRWRACLPPST